ncbi:MAG: nitroreductase [Candidatus Marinimicrobia bacterium]|jgi:nitroreductase|nr:nitroreductase [Candidatus Neomarinimicrobiota bacterium]
MEFLDVIANRVSCRSYNGKEVSQEKLDAILEVMQLAPTAAHYQSYRVRVSKDGELIDALAKIAGQEDRFSGAGAVIVFFAVPEEPAERFADRGRDLYSVQDATLACAYAQLGAANEGVESLWVGSFDESAVLEACGLSAKGKDGLGLRPVAVSLFGHTDEKPVRSGRKGLEELEV